MKPIWDFLGSVRLAIVLLIIITVVSVLGMLIPQDLPTTRYIGTLGSFWGKIVLVTGFYKVFYSGWFYMLLGILSLNIIVCSIDRMWKNLRKSFSPVFLPLESGLSKFKIQSSFSFQGKKEDVRKAVIKMLQGKLFTVSEKSEADTIQIAAHKGKMKFIGSLVFHLSLVLLFVGGLIGKRTGYSYPLHLKKGEVSAVREEKFLVRCDWFRLEKNDKGEIKDYKSKLALLRPDSTLILEKVIEVNDPLSYNGIRFYQSTYGEEAVNEVRLTVNGPDIEGEITGLFSLNKPVPLKRSGLSVMVLDYYPDFIIDMKTRMAGTRSNSPNNPACMVIITNDLDTLYKHWEFMRFPDMHQEKEAYSVRFIDYIPNYFTGIQVRKNPGVPLIWIGIISMTLGILFIFHISKRSIWVLISGPDNGNVTVSLGGVSDRPQASFKNEIEKMSRSLQLKLEV